MKIATVRKPREFYEEEETTEFVQEAERQRRETVASEILPQLLEFAKKQNTKRFWVLLEGQTMIRLAHELIRTTSLPVYAQVMDPPLNWFISHRVDKASQRSLLANYDDVLRGARSSAAASWNMASAFSRQFGPSVPVVPSLPAWVARRPATAHNNAAAFRIGVAGQLYANQEWNRLLRAVDSQGWRIGSSRIEIHAFTTYAIDSTHELAGRIVRRGWQESVEELIGDLSELDLLYLPYRFGEDHVEEATFCFPSKLTTYFASGRPVLFHAPAYSSPVQFAAERNAGFICDRPSEDALWDAITRAYTDREQYSIAAVNGRSAFDTLLTYDHLRSSVRKVLSF